MKNILFILSFSMLSSIAIAQAELGLKVGIGTSNIVMVDKPESFTDNYFDYQLAYQFGVYGAAALCDRIHLRSEILFNQKGGHHLGFNQNLNYLSLPVLLQYRILNHVRIEVGPEVGYLIPPKRAVMNYKSYDVGFNIGADYELFSKVLIAARYNIGLGNVLDEKIFFNSQSSDYMRLQNRSLQLSMGYRIL